MMKIIKAPKLSKELENIPFEIKEDKIYVKYLGGIQAGFPSPAEDFSAKKLSLDERYITNPLNTYIIKVRGNSMFPTLQIGDLLIIKSDEELTDNKIAIVSINNSDYTVKRFDKKNKMLLADNPDFQNISINEEDTILCLGIVKQLIRDI